MDYTIFNDYRQNIVVKLVNRPYHYPYSYTDDKRIAIFERDAKTGEMRELAIENLEKTYWDNSDIIRIHYINGYSRSYTDILSAVLINKVKEFDLLNPRMNSIKIFVREEFGTVSGSTIYSIVVDPENVKILMEYDPNRKIDNFEESLRKKYGVQLDAYSHNPEYLKKAMDKLAINSTYGMGGHTCIDVNIEESLRKVCEKYGKGDQMVNYSTDRANEVTAKQMAVQFVKDVIFNNPATIVFWRDGTKTVVKCQDGDIYDARIGIMNCFMKKFFGNIGKYNTVLDEIEARGFWQGPKPAKINTEKFKAGDQDATDDILGVFLKNLFKNSLDGIVESFSQVTNNIKALDDSLKNDQTESVSAPTEAKCLHTICESVEYCDVLYDDGTCPLYNTSIGSCAFDVGPLRYSDHVFTEDFMRNLPIYVKEEVEQIRAYCKTHTSCEKCEFYCEGDYYGLICAFKCYRPCAYFNEAFNEKVNERLADLNSSKEEINE